MSKQKSKDYSPTDSSSTDSASTDHSSMDSNSTVSSDTANDLADDTSVSNNTDNSKSSSAANIVTLILARDTGGKAKYDRAFYIPKYQRNLQDMPNGAALLMNNKEDKEFLQNTLSLYKKLIEEKILIIHGEQ